MYYNRIQFYFRKFSFLTAWERRSEVPLCDCVTVTDGTSTAV